VAETAVIGVADELRGEAPKAFIVRRQGAALDERGAREWCRERLAAYKCPRVFEFVDELPRNPTGKVDKRALREG